ncbi:metal-dependent hydrolase [Andreprevotia chitinilytica]|uniref:metal-dependent hydrolase n=1 Tax=Andreprevotia chitinilytica TaxID=396808 RepID=UPI000558A09D|nr:metal-dependent hydrolase [Andreprevotia chitinilytica]
MTTIFTHALVGATLVRCLPPTWREKRLYALAAIGAMLPDLDTITFRLGIPYASPFGHRGASHSLVFALIAGLVLATGFYGRDGWHRWLGASAILAAAVATHPLLDACTNGGLGVALFWPFSTERFFFSIHPIAVSPIGHRFFSASGLHTLSSELVWVALPCLALWLILASYPHSTRKE